METQRPTERNRTPPGRGSRRAILGLALGALVALVGIEATAATPKSGPNARLDAATRRRRHKPKPKPRPKYKTVTRTFTNASPIIIRDYTIATPYPGLPLPFPSEIRVSGLRQGRLLDVNVTLHGFRHDKPYDVDLQLEAPNGRRAVLMSDVGSRLSVEDLTLTLDDQAAAFLPAYSPLGSGAFIPTNVVDLGVQGGDDPFPPPAAPSSNVALATFNGVNPNGFWKLYVLDDAALSAGGIDGGWSLTVRARVRIKPAR